MRNRFYQLLSIGLFVFGCSNGTGPGGSEITNGIIVDAGGKGVSGITVTAYPEQFIAGHYSESAVLQTQCGPDGAFTLPIDSGTYNVFAVDTVGGVGIMVADVGPKEDLGVLQLEDLGVLGGTLTFADDYPGDVVVYSPGTPFETKVNTGDTAFSFDLVPAGAYQLGFARVPLVGGCKPGIDCLPGDGSPATAAGGFTVTGGSATVIDTTINTSELGVLP